jgi:hypothetical protein
METILERVLLSEDSKKIKQAEQSAATRAEMLNEVAQILDIDSTSEIMLEDVPELVENAMLDIPAIRKLSENVAMESIKVPANIAAAKATLEALIRKYGAGLFDHLAYIKLKGVFEVDNDSLEAYANSQRVYAETDKEIERYEGAQNLCEFLNRLKLGFGSYEKAQFHNSLIEWSLLENCWVPSIHFIKG